MKKFWIQIIALIVVIVGSLYYTFQRQGSPFTNIDTKVEKKIKINNVEVSAEIVDTPALRSKGLGGRDILPENKGMLFTFSEPKKYRFWMKSMKFPIDILFIKESKVVDLLQNVPVPKPGIQDSQLPIYEASEPIDKVLEVNALFVEGHGIKVGDSIEIY